MTNDLAKIAELEQRLATAERWIEALKTAADAHLGAIEKLTALLDRLTIKLQDKRII